MEKESGTSARLMILYESGCVIFLLNIFYRRWDIFNSNFSYWVIEMKFLLADHSNFSPVCPIKRFL